MPGRREESVEYLFEYLSSEVSNALCDAENRQWYPGCNTIEAVHLLLGAYQESNDYFDVTRFDGEGFRSFHPSQTDLINAVRSVMPAKKERGRGAMQYGRTAMAVRKNALKLAGTDFVEMSHLCLALLLRKDIQAVLRKAGLTLQELRTLKYEMVELCIKHAGAERPRASLQELRYKRLYVLQGITRKQMTALRRAGIDAKFFSQKGCPVEGVALASDDLTGACRQLEMEPFARTCVFFTANEEVLHTALRPNHRPTNAAHATVCLMRAIEDIICQGDGWDANSHFNLPIVTMFNEHVVPRVESAVDVSIFSDALAAARTDDNGEYFRVGLTFWHNEMRTARRELEDSGTVRRDPVRISLSAEEVQRATNILLGSDDPAFVYADIYERSMMIRMHCGLFKEHGTRTILLDSLLRKCAPHLHPDMRLQDFVSSFPTDDLAAAPAQNLTLSGFVESNGRAKFAQTLVHGVFMRGFEGQVVMHECHQPRDICVPCDDNYYVFFPREGSGIAACSEVPRGDCVPILDQSGLVMAEVGERCLRIYKNFVTAADFGELEPFAKFLRTARTLRLMASQSCQAKQLVTQKFITECLFALKMCTPESNEQATASLLKQASEDVVARIDQARGIEHRTTAGDLTAESQFGPEFDSLMELEKVMDVEVTLHELIVKTHTIFCRDDRTDRVHELGKFEIVIPFEDSTRVRFMNKTRIVTADAENGYRFCAPHVGEAGNPCLGNIQGILPELVYKRQFVPAVQVCIAFLETANTNDPWGKNVDKFPLANTSR